MQQITFPVGPLACNCSIVAADGARDAFVIDPGDRTDFILQWLAQRELRLGGILITHAHIDHIGGAARLRQATGAPVYLNSRDQFLNEGLEWQAQWLGVPTPESAPVDEDLRENQVLTLDGLCFEILETPGHGPETTMGRERGRNPFLRDL